MNGALCGAGVLSLWLRSEECDDVRLICLRCAVFPPAQAHTCLLAQQIGTELQGGRGERTGWFTKRLTSAGKDSF